MRVLYKGEVGSGIFLKFFQLHMDRFLSLESAVVPIALTNNSRRKKNRQFQQYRNCYRTNCSVGHWGLSETRKPAKKIYQNRKTGINIAQDRKTAENNDPNR